MGSRKRKIWSDYDLASSEYLTGLTKFVTYAFEKTPSEDKTIACPCSGCVRYHRCSEKDVYDHLVIKGPMRDFEKWYDDFDFGSKSVSPQDDQRSKISVRDRMIEMLEDAYGIHDNTSKDIVRTTSDTPISNNYDQFDQDFSISDIREEAVESHHSDLDMFNKLLQDDKLELYPGCKRSIKPRGAFELGDDNAEIDLDIEDNSLSGTMQDIFDLDIDVSGVEGTYVIMTKRRRLTRIRVLENTSFNFEDVQSHTNTSSNTEEGRNMNSNVGNEGSNTRDDLNGQTQIPSSFEFSRGPTILTDIWNQPPDEKWVVKFNKQGQPYGDDSTTLSSFIGTIGRNPELAPQGYSDWRLVPKEYKDRCMNEIKV
ncbi:hypothetical protein KSS87_005607 [Heliosperma pusillum]|nr:hypothetical protein KSS87_005607 [Heliosperma pusillum]